MASFKSVLQVKGKQYTVLYSDFDIHQFTDSLGRPASPTFGGVYALDVESPPANDGTLFEWVVDPALFLNGQVLIKNLTGTTLKVIKLYNAYCVDLEQHFDGTGLSAEQSSLRLSLRISPQAVRVGEQFHDNNWPAPEPIVDWDWADMDAACNPKPQTDNEPSALSEGLHTLLDVVGMIPVVGEVADAANAVLYAAEGDMTNAALSAAAMIPVVGNVATGAKLVNKGSKALKAGLKNAGSMTKADILLDVQRNFPSLKLKGSSPDGRFHEFVDSRGTTRLKIHPPDKVTKYDHIHIYNRAGQPLDADLKVGDVKSADVHIRIKP